MITYPARRAKSDTEIALEKADKSRQHLDLAAQPAHAADALRAETSGYLLPIVIVGQRRPPAPSAADKMKFSFAKILQSISGFSTPIFCVSWNPPTIEWDRIRKL
jgi:hypothetical protein